MNPYKHNATSVRHSISSSGDHPQVVIFPPLLPLGAIGLGVVLEWLFPRTTELAGLPAAVRQISAGFFFVSGLLVMVGSRRAMVRAGTNVDPRQPTLHLVESWPFNWTRNPMYLGGNVAALGLGLFLRLHWMVLLYPIAMVICHYGVVLREEAYLRQKFGAKYLAYQSRVRRWL